MTSWREVLKATQGLQVRDSWATLWGKKIYDANEWQITTLTGSLPLSFLSKGEALTDYRLYGTSEGVGVETENLFNKDAKDTNNGFINDVYMTSNGNTASSSACIVSEFISVTPNTSYTLYRDTTSGSSLAICEYDSNKNYIMGTQYNYRSSVTISTSQNTAYVRASIYKTNVQRTMFVSGTTAPTAYIPFGYKIPLTNTSGVTENLWDENYTDIASGVNVTYKPIFVGEGSFTLSSNCPLASGASADIFLLAGNVSSGASTVGNGVYENRPVTVTSVDSYVTIGYRIYLNEDPRDYQTMLNAGPTALPYVPHRYSSTYPLYIGSTKLGEEEYVDFGEQKVYKRTANLLKLDRAKSITFTIDERYYIYGGVVNAPTAQPENIVSADINENYVEVHSKTGAGIGYIVKVKPNTTYTLSFDLDVSVSDDKSTAVLNTISNGGVLGSFVAIYGGNNKCTITTLENSQYLYMTFRVVNVKAKYTNITLTEGSTPPESYIPYFNPTEPPLPLSAINTYRGENTLSSTETLGECSVTGKIKSI